MATDPNLRLSDQPWTPASPSPNGGPDPSGVPAWKLLLRGAVGSCPVCGGRGLFPRFLVIAPNCPTCGYRFERESGWWLGAMTMNIGGAIVLFGVFFVGALLLTYPDVPWTLLTVLGAVLMCLFPIAFAPVSKTLWIALDILLTRMG